MPNTKKRPSLTSQESCSAVIIADLVADIEPGSRRASLRSNRSNNSNKSAKAVTNMAFEGGQEGGPPHANGGTSDISRGVILNALHSGQMDSRAGKTIQLADVFTPGEQPGDKETATEEVSTDFSDMSLGRKIAFGFSFLPSVMFVLCFAIILPCNKYVPPNPCVHQMWQISINYTDVTPSTLSVPRSLLVAVSDGTGSAVVSFDATSGGQLWDKHLLHPAVFMDCGHLGQNGNESCLLQDNRGDLHLMNATDGKLIESWNIRDDEPPSLPVIMPDCIGDGESVFGMATSPYLVELIFGGTDLSSVRVPGCQDVPRRLTPWMKRSGETDLLMTCRNGTNEVLMRFPQAKWCAHAHEGKPQAEASVLLKRNIGTWNIVTNDEGLFVWVGDDVIMFDSNATLQWTVSSNPHSNKNRFMLLGTFSDKQKQLALLSGNDTGNLLVTSLNISDGNMISSKSISNTEAIDVATVKGENKDLIVILKKKTGEIEGGFAGAAFSHLSDASNSLLESLTHEGANSTTSSFGISHEISFMILGEEHEDYVLYSKKMNSTQGASTESALRVVPGDRDNDPKIFVLHKGDSNTELHALRVSNWDVSALKTTPCTN